MKPCPKHGDDGNLDQLTNICGNGCGWRPKKRKSVKKAIGLKKPTAKARKGKYLDWSESCKYLESKCGKKLRDYANKWSEGGDTSNEYRDFWHWIIHNHEISNWSEFSLVISEYTNEEPWVMEILALIKAEFGDEPCFWAEW